MLDQVIYCLALITLVTVPATLLAWLLIHHFVSLWRHVGSSWTMIAVSAVTVLAMLVMYLVREPLLRIRFGVYWPSALAGAILLALSFYLNALVYKRVPTSMALGLEEISAGDPGELVTDGVYSRLRHPRFLGMALAVAAMALLTNFATIYALFVLYVAAIFLIARLEDRELLERFGSQYAEYARTVPRFFPRLRGLG
jgi:protein-S-isoprenylcysteine O-methyltransferase Ste14